MMAGMVRKTWIVGGVCTVLAVGSAAVGAEYAWQVAGSHGQDDSAGIVDSSRLTLAVSYYPRPVDDTRGPYALAPFLSRSSYVTVGLSRSREDTELVGTSVWGGSPEFIGRLVELYGQSTAESAAWSLSGRYVWPVSGWFAGGAVERGATEVSPGAQDMHRSAFLVVAGRYLGDTTTLDVSLGTDSNREDPDEVVCEAFAWRCYGLAGADTDTEVVIVSVHHVGELWGRGYAVEADARSSRSEYSLVLPRLLDPQRRPIAVDPSRRGEYALDDGDKLYSDKSQLYVLSAQWFPTIALGVRLSYVNIRQDESGNADGIGLSAGWFLRRHLSATVSFSRTRLDAFEPRFRDSDTASIRLLGRF